MKLFTVTKGDFSGNLETFDTDDISKTKANTPYHAVRLNVAVSLSQIETMLARTNDGQSK